MKNDLTVIVGGKKVACTSAAKTGMAAINEELTAIAEPLKIAAACSRVLGELGMFTDLGYGEKLDERFLDRAKIVHGRLLPHARKVEEAEAMLLDVIAPYHNPITYSLATKMLAVLFGALSKRKADDADENANTLLMACADMFNPVNDAIGDSTGLWKPPPKHPLCLALAIKALLAKSVFSPSPSELRLTLQDVLKRMNYKLEPLSRFLSALRRADRILFKFDRDAWTKAYADVRSNVVLVMLGDDEGDESSGHWQALNQLWEARRDAEETLQIAHAAACKTPVVKRTRKPKRAE
jgi:hypothetical protein